MYLAPFADGARSAERARIRILKTGYVFGRRRVWSKREDEVCRVFYPRYDLMERLLHDRTAEAIQYRCRYLGLAPKTNRWTAGELSRLKRVYPAGTWEEILEAVPTKTRAQIRYAAQYYKLRRDRKPYKPTGHVAIDQIRTRCFECNYTMRDADILASSKSYFYKAHWHSKWINHKAIARAVKALDGRLVVEWDVSLRESGQLPCGDLWRD
jgi:hypothetical protein